MYILSRGYDYESKRKTKEDEKAMLRLLKKEYEIEKKLQTYCATVHFLTVDHHTVYE